MDRSSASRASRWVSWTLIVGSLVVFIAGQYTATQWLYESRVMLEKLLSKLPRWTYWRPPSWVIAVSCALAAAFLLASLSRRGRAWLRMRPRLSRPSAHGTDYLRAFALALGTTALGTAALVWAKRPLWPLGDADKVGVLVAILYAFWRLRPIRVALRQWGWHRGRAAWREISIGVLFGVNFYFLCYLPREARQLASVNAFGAWTTLGIVVWAPIVEETLFRGMLYRYLRDRWRWPAAVLVSAVIFAVLHVAFRVGAAGELRLALAPPLYALVGGIVFALLREWRASLLAPVAAHAAGNLIATFSVSVL